MLLEVKERDYDLRHVLMTSPLMKRGWYFQELMLSRRILHWTSNGLYLECQTSNFIEGRPRRLARYSGYIEPREALSVPNDKVLAQDDWYQIINRYSPMQLTYESDRMFAIHGIASLLTQRYGAEYFHGVFRSSIAQGLAWSYVCDDLMDVDELDLRMRPPKHVEAQFPTWSWASNCPVYFRAIEDAGFICDDHPQRPPLFTVHPENMSLTEGIDSRLYIRAPLIGVFLQRIDDELMACTKNGRGKEINGRALGYSDAQRSNQHDTLYDSFLAGLDEGLSTQWLPLGRTAEDKDWYIGILVQRKRETLYQRYGLLRIEWGSCDIEDLFDTVEEIILE